MIQVQIRCSIQHGYFVAKYKMQQRSSITNARETHIIFFLLSVTPLGEKDYLFVILSLSLSLFLDHSHFTTPDENTHVASPGQLFLDS